MRARGRAAAVPCLPLGCGDPSQGLNIVWGSMLETWLAIWVGEPRDLGPRGQVLGLFLGLRGWKGEGDPVRLVAK